MDEQDVSLTAAVLITGGGRGIGRAITSYLARQQPVVIVGRNTTDLVSTCHDIQAKGGRAIACTGDITDPTTAQRAIIAATEQGWWIAHLVCNAGIGKSGPTETFPFELWRQIFAVNVDGCFHCVQACLPDMVERRKGAISIISSLAGVNGVAFDAAYTASKHALVGFARALSQEYGKHGIIVAALCPSFIESDMTQRTLRGMMKRRNLTEAEAKQRLASHCPSGRILPAEEIAEAIALIGAGRVTEATQLAVAGGYPLICEQ